MAPKEELQSAERARGWFEKANVEGVVALRPVSSEKRISYNDSLWMSPSYNTFWGYYGYGYSSVVVIGGVDRDTVITVEKPDLQRAAQPVDVGGGQRTRNPENAAEVHRGSGQGVGEGTPEARIGAKMMNQLRHGVILAVMMATTGVSAQQPAATPAETKDTNLRAYVELLRADVRAQKVAFLTELMEFTEAEDKAFWPIYRAYDTELSAINDERVTGIEEYARNYDKVTTRSPTSWPPKRSSSKGAARRSSKNITRSSRRRSQRRPRPGFSRSRTSCC